MKKYFTLLFVALMLTGAWLNVSAAEILVAEYNFDDGADFPEGWAYDGDAFSCKPASDFGFEALSGECVLGKATVSQAEVLYTPKIQLVAGKRCTIKFSFIAPADAYLKDYRSQGFIIKAGSTQSQLDHTVQVGVVEAKDHPEWETVSFSFVPENDGEYCFSISFTDGLVGGSERPVALDDVTVSVEETSGDNPENPETPAGGAFTLTYDFENEEDFPGEWMSDGFKREEGDYFGFTAKSGSYIVGKATGKPGEALYTPMMKLKGGEKCKIAFSYIAPEGSIYVYSFGLNIKAGTAQDAESQTIQVGEVEKKGYPDWTDFEFEFTPESDGDYCFSLTLTAYTTGSGKSFGFDDFVITGVAPGGDDEPVEPVDPTPSEAFEIETNFDEDTDFADGAMVPAGWLNEAPGFKRETSDYFGYPTKSGDYMLGAVTAAVGEVIYTPMYKLVGGEKATIEFSLFRQGDIYVRAYGVDIKAGNAQNADAQTVSVGSIEPDNSGKWVDYKFDFTPAADGEYCFSLNITHGLVGKGQFIAFDDIFISGKRPVEEKDPEIVLEPNEDNLMDCIDLPYIETFSDSEHYDGKSHLPIGWHSVGTSVWVTANLDKLLPGVEGLYYMVTPAGSAERDEKAFTPFFNLEAGTEYTISFYTMIEGNWDDEGELHVPALQFTVGTEQDSEFHKVLATYDEQHTKWVKRDLTFAPEVSGPYCFSFAVSGPANAGMVAVDYFQITAPGLTPRVEPSFAPAGMIDLYTDDIIAFKDMPVEIVNTSRYAESYKWTLSQNDTEIDSSTDVNPSFIVPSSGTYKVGLEATNSRGTRSTSKTFNFSVLGEDESTTDYALHLHNSSSDMLIDRGQVPAFDTDPEGDFITGYNHYYFKVAQRYNFSPDTEIWVKQVSFWVAERRFRNATSALSDDREKSFALVLYGAKEDGTIDPETVFGRVNMTMGEAVGAYGLGSISAEGYFIEFPEPVKVSGTVYVAMEFDPSLTIDAEDVNLGRSYFATTAVKFGHGITGLYAQPYAVPEGSVISADGGWYSIDKLDITKKGYGAGWELWVAMQDPKQSGVAVNQFGEIVFGARFDNSGILSVSGTVEGETISVYNVSGQLVAQTSASQDCTEIEASHLPKGIYIVKGEAGSIKVVK